MMKKFIYNTAKYLFAGVIIYFAIVGVGAFINNNQDQNINNINKIPNPVVVVSNSNTDKSTMLDYIVTVQVNVKNIGQSGYILVKVRLFNDSNLDLYKTKKIYLSQEESIVIEFDFPEVEIKDKAIKYLVSFPLVDY